MIPSLLQDKLVEEINTLFSGFKLKNAEGEKVSINVYPQFLPAKTGQKDKNHFPYILVILLDGDIKKTEANICRVLIMVGIYDDDTNHQGYKDVLNVMQKIYNYLARKRIIDKKYELKYPIDWKLSDEDTYPYYFGAIETNWTVGKVFMTDNLI